jgi:3-oxoacyl-[acyl-carrier-protein] synthase II
MKRVVVTGLGAVTPIGNDVDSFWNGLISGKSGAGKITKFNTDGFDVKIACEVKNFDISNLIERKKLRHMDPFVQYALYCAIQAINDAKLDLKKENLERIGVIVGSGIGGMEIWEQQYKIFLEKGPSKLSPFFIPMMITNMASANIAIHFGLKGPNTCAVTACATGNHAIGEAFRIIQQGHADVMLAGGTEAAITPLGVAGFIANKALSTRNDEPEKASRPFDKDRDGFVMGEGAGVVVLEELEHALARNANIYAEVVGYGMSCDAYHVTAPAPRGEGGARAMKLAIEDANLPFDSVDYINAHGTGTPLGDIAETEAIKDVFGQHAYKLSVSSIKSMIGHLLGAAGGVEFIATVLTVKNDIIPPTINLDNPDPQCDLDYVPNKAKEKKVNVALTNAFGFGGHNAVLAVKKFVKD